MTAVDICEKRRGPIGLCILLTFRDRLQSRYGGQNHLKFCVVCPPKTGRQYPKSVNVQTVLLFMPRVIPLCPWILIPFGWNINIQTIIIFMTTVVPGTRYTYYGRVTRLFNPFISAVPFLGQITWKLTGLSPQRDCRTTNKTVKIAPPPAPPPRWDDVPRRASPRQGGRWSLTTAPIHLRPMHRSAL